MHWLSESDLLKCMIFFLAVWNQFTFVQNFNYMVKDFDDLCFHWYDHRVRIQNGWLWILCTLILLIMTGLESFLLENSSKVHALWNIIFINSWGTRTLTTWCRKILFFLFTEMWGYHVLIWQCITVPASRWWKRADSIYMHCPDKGV